MLVNRFEFWRLIFSPVCGFDGPLAIGYFFGEGARGVVAPFLGSKGWTAVMEVGVACAKDLEILVVLERWWKMDGASCDVGETSTRV